MTYIGSARLEAEGLDDFELTIEHGIAIDALDIGYPSIRTVAEDHPDRHGQDDQTALFGGRAVVLSGAIVPTATASRQEVLDRLGAFLVPWRRPHLVYELEPGSGLRRIRLAPDQHSRPITQPNLAQVTMGWRAPDGIQEAYDLLSVEGEPGEGYSETYEEIYEGIPALEFDLPGNVPVYPILRAYGPANGVEVVNATTGARIKFTDTILATDADYVEIDHVNRIARINGAGLAIDTIVLPMSSWWTLEPGVNSLRYRPVGSGLAAHLVASARPGWI